MQLQNAEISQRVIEDIINLQGNEIARLRHELDEANGVIDSLKKTAAEDGEAKDLRQELRSIIEAVTDIGKLQENVRTTESVNGALRGDIKSLEEQLDESRTALESTKEQLSKTLASEAASMQDVERLATLSSGLSTELSTVNGNCIKLDEKLAQCKSENSLLSNEVSALRASQSALQDRLHGYEMRYADLSAENRSLSLALEAVQHSSNNKVSASKTANDDLKAKQEKDDKVEQIYQDVQKLLELAIVQANASQINAQADDSCLAQERAQAALEELKALNVKLSRELLEACASRDALTERLDRQEAMQDDVTEQLHRLELEAHLTSQQLSSVSESRDALQDELASAKAMCVITRDRLLSDLGEASDSVPDSLGALLADIDCITKRTQEMQAELLRSEREARSVSQDLMQEQITRLLDSVTEEDVSLGVLCEECDKLQEGVAALLEDFNKICQQLADCQLELESAKERERSVEKVLAPQNQETVSDDIGRGTPAQEFSDPLSRPATSTGSWNLVATDGEMAHGSEINHNLRLGNTSKSVETMFVPFATHAVNAAEILQTLNSARVCLTTAEDLVWVNCPDHAYFVKPVQVLGNGSLLRACKNNAINRLRQQGNTELILHVSGGYYYVGTYMIGDQERLSRREFKQLPQPAQATLVHPSRRTSEMYASGLKFPVRRIGYDQSFYARLLRYWRPSATSRKNT